VLLLCLCKSFQRTLSLCFNFTSQKAHFVKASAKVYRISFTTKSFGEYFSKSLYFSLQGTTPYTKTKHKSNYKPQDSPYHKTQSKSHPKQQTELKTKIAFYKNAVFTSK
ncbi:hypothetical protein, partial [Prevotella histicola]|uniref:hypothetical protein n=1 Tax=Prevotella histicola TaxID=470565 RepID=UPI00242AE213